MIQEYQLRILPEQAASEQSLKQYIGREKGLDIRTIQAVRTLRRSIDARQRVIFINLKVRVFINEEPEAEEFVRTEYRNVEGRQPVVVVGAGPGGLFAALKLIELGLRPVVVERGKDVRARKEDLARISREHKVDPESNYSFGEGGAGAYSDGKLYTRSKKRGNVEKILNVFCQHGASTSILVDAHPHIGTDKLPRVIENMRQTILACGGEVHFETRMDGLIIENDKVTGIRTNRGTEFHGPVILATGHSARDVYRWLFANDVYIEAKGLAAGVRLEHPSLLIDQIQYHRIQLRAASGGPGSVQLLYVSGRLRGTRGQRPSPDCGERHESEQPRHEMEQLGNGGGNPSGRSCRSDPGGTGGSFRQLGGIADRGTAADPSGSGRGPSAGHDAVSGKAGTDVLATGKHAADGSRAAYGGFHPKETQLRPSGKFIQSGAGVVAAALLASSLHRHTPE